MSDVKGTLSMARRAGMLVGGSDEVKSLVRRKEAKLVLMASDVSPKTLKEFEWECSREKVPLIILPDAMDDISEAVGKRFGVMALSDAGFARSVMKKTEK